MPRKITIPAPCHEDWSLMTENNKGRHCAQCEKTVVDFTDWKPQEILYYLSEKKTEKVCGRFTAQQLEEEIPTPEDFVKQISYFRMPMIRKVAAIFLFAFSVMAASCSEGGSGAVNVPALNPAEVDSPPTLLGDTVLLAPSLGTPVQVPVKRPLKGKVVCVNTPEKDLKKDINIIDPSFSNGSLVDEIAVNDTMPRQQKDEPAIMGMIAMPQKQLRKN